MAGSPDQVHVRSPFPPIGDYGFLSDCESAALVAPSGNVEWMCLPRIDSPSVFGAMLDRGAGGFRLGPADVMVPAARRYLPGTMILETSWGTPTGWIIVRDALADRPLAPRGRALHAPTAGRPTDYEAEHVLLRIVRCVNGEVQIDDGLRAGLRLRPRRRRSGRTRTTATTRRRAARRRQPTSRSADDRPAARLRGRRRATARTLLKEGDHALRRAVVERARAAGDVRRGLPAAGLDRAPLAALAGPGRVPRPPVAQHLQRSALTLKGLTYAPTGALIAAPHHVAAGDTGRRAQLGLPLHLDPRLHLRAVGAVHPRLRLGGRRLLLLHRRRRRARRTTCRSCTASAASRT